MTIRFTILEWKQKGTDLFGDDPLSWRFVCPNCGFVQSGYTLIERSKKAINLSEPFDKNTAMNRVYFSCSGRWPLKGEQVGELGDRKAPCNYTAGGLFNICKTEVVDDDGESHFIFDFDAE